MLLKKLENSEQSHNIRIRKPKSITRDSLMLAHNPEYVDDFLEGRLSEKEMRRIGLTPWTPKMIERTLRLTSGALEATIYAVNNGGITGNMAGGTHHAHRDFGSGYCVFNDMAYASLHLIRTHKVKKILIFDTDVHQGDGTASILKDNDKIFTCSIHCKNNFPFRKSKSDMDVELDDNLEDYEYLEILNQTLNSCLKNFNPELVIFDTGVDIHKNDKLGNLKITNEGLLKRDITVLEFFKNKSIPIATVIGGGYSNDKLELAKRHSLIFKATSMVFN